MASEFLISIAKFLNISVLALLIVFSIGGFLWGLICVCFLERVREQKVVRRRYDKRYERRRQIRDFGIQLMTLSTLTGSVLYSAFGYQQSRHEFTITQRPFLRAEPVAFDSGNLYQVSERGGSILVTYQFKITNVGSTPAYDVILVKTGWIGGKSVRAEDPGNLQVVFPQDSVFVQMPFVLTPKSGKSALALTQALTQDKKLNLRINYRGASSRSGWPYFTEYDLEYPAIDQSRLNKMQADKADLHNSHGLVP